MDGLVWLSCQSITPLIGDSNVFTYLYLFIFFKKSRDIPEFNQIQVIINWHSKTTFKSSRTTYCKLVTRAVCRTQEKLLV